MTVKKRAKPKGKTTKKARRKKLPPAPGKLTGGEMNGFPLRRVLVSDLTPAEYNPREIDDDALDGLQASVDRFGLPQGIVWNVTTHRIVGGHQRLKTLDPDSETDVVQVELSEAEEKALNLAFNNPHIMGDWTADLNGLLDAIESGLPELMDDLNLAELRIEVPDLGDLAPPGEFPPPPEGGGNATDHECPRCGYSW